METNQENANVDYNEALKDTYALDEKAEQFYNKPENQAIMSERLSQIKEIPSDLDTPKVLVKLGDPNQADKFVHMKDEDGREYVIALPIQRHAYHSEIANFSRKLYGKDMTVLGGGYTQFEDGVLVIKGTSQGFGEADKARVQEILQEAFPDLEIRAVAEYASDKNVAEQNKLRDYERAMEHIDGKVARELYADVVNNRALRLGYDFANPPVPIEGSEDQICYMIYQSENGSSFGVDTLYVGFQDSSGAIETKEAARSRWDLTVQEASVDNGILKITFVAHDKQGTIECPVAELRNLRSVSTLEDTEQALVEMYQNYQKIYQDPVVGRVYHRYNTKKEA